MPVSDPIADLLTRMRNAQHARATRCHIPWSKIKEQICDVLMREGLLTTVEVQGEGIGREIVVTFASDRPALTLKRVSKPGRRLYAGKKDLQPVLRGFGIAVVTTSEGLMSDREARKKGIGGEVLCTVA